LPSLVVVAHTLPETREGFTLGVDVSSFCRAFLITRLVVENRAQRDGLIAVLLYPARFPAIPALFLFLAVVLVWAQVFAPASGVQIVHSTVLSSLLYVENWHIVAVGGVGGVGLIRDPAAQAWSLSVEEQFYVVWPIILIMAGVEGPRTALILAACGATLSVAESIGFGFPRRHVVRVFMARTRELANCWRLCVALLRSVISFRAFLWSRLCGILEAQQVARLWCIRRGRARVNVQESNGRPRMAHTARRSSILR